ncbi:MAG TPA: diheme cytochrome c-553 [Burkholderiaceae bacterium]|nr:diheme cytochrome c-553 [Burkholderiaceae bacterium]
MSSTQLARVSLGAATIALSAFAWLAQPKSALSAPNEETRPGSAAPADKLARGKYLVTIAGCNDCHTPLKMGPAGPEPDMSRMLSGHPEGMQLPPAPAPAPGPWLVTVAATNTAWSGPWGVSYTANLTPDAETGLGKWTLRDFMATLRTGRHMGRGRLILPPMPIPMYKHFTDSDMDAIFTYLRSIPPVQNRVPEPLPPVATTASTQ